LGPWMLLLKFLASYNGEYWDCGSLSYNLVVGYHSVEGIYFLQLQPPRLRQWVP
jgi:hypothetical protein